MKKDFQRYPELERQFHNDMATAFSKISYFNRVHVPMVIHLGPESWDFWIRNYTEDHPHFIDHTLPTRFMDMLRHLKKERTCNPDDQRIQACHAKLKKALEADNKKGLQGMCGKALQEGQVCCSAPNKSCGDFAFAKDIAKTFSRNLPGIGQAFSQLQAMKGNTAEACKLSHLSNIAGGLGDLHLKSCNKAIDGCRDTCDAQLTKFKEEFKSCYKIGEKEKIEDVVAKARSEEDAEDPHYQCFEQIKELAEAYKELSRDSEYALTEDSDHEEIVSCYNEIAKHAPGQQNAGAQGGLNPTQALAVNMCYNQLKQSKAYQGSPPVVNPYQPSQNRSPMSFAGGTPTRSDFQGPALDEMEGAPPSDDEDDFINTKAAKQGTNELGFKSPSNSGAGGGGGGLNSGGGPGGGSGDGEKGAGAFAGGKGKSKQIPFYTGEKQRGGGDGNSWQPEDKEDRRVLRDRDRARELKKLPKRYLTDEEKDLVKMYSKVGKHESIFERASFALHWFCRNYGCYKYEELMGIPDYARTKREP